MFDPPNSLVGGFLLQIGFLKVNIIKYEKR